MVKQIMDPVHGLIELDHQLVQIIDTPQFQRLRNLSQCGTTYYVFAGATHKRFEHSIGTSHLAGMLLENIGKVQPELGLTQEEILLVKTAGLCHDMGHGPFSHAFDHFVGQVFPTSTWTHEQASSMMFDYMVDENHIDIDPDSARFVHQLIDPKNNFPTASRKRFLYDIVSNSRNSIDVDKFDYLTRDSHCLGLKGWHDSYRLIQIARVINDEICYPAKHAFNIYQLFHTRYSLFKTVYSHKVAAAVQLMITDAFIAADSSLGISKSIDDPEAYLHMTDNLVNQIESSKDPGLEQSRSILKKIRHRQLYKVAAEIVLKYADGKRLGNVRPVDITACQPSPGRLLPDDIIVQLFNMDYTQKEGNPVSNVKFFNSPDLKISFTMKSSEVSFIVPEMFCECVFRVYVRRPTEENLEWARQALDRFCKNRAIPTPGPVYSLPTTPKKLPTALLAQSSSSARQLVYVPSNGRQSSS